MGTGKGLPYLQEHQLLTSYTIRVAAIAALVVAISFITWGKVGVNLADEGFLGAIRDGSN